jgi:integrase
MVNFLAQGLYDGTVRYVKDQMGHSAIQITVDTYGHLITGASINWVDGLDRKTPRNKMQLGRNRR